MGGQFVCPECNGPLVPSAAMVGRQMRCPRCATLVELPYFSRGRRGRRSNPASGWAWVVLTVGLTVVLVSATYLMVRGKIRAQQRATFETLVREAESDEAAGRLDRAVDRLVTAVELGKGSEIADAATLEELAARRDAVAERRDRAWRSGLIARAQRDMAEARRLLRGGIMELEQAIDACEGIERMLGEVDTEESTGLRRQAQALVTELARERGVIIADAVGSFATGDAEGYRKALRPILEAHLRGRGYLPDRRESVFAEVWMTASPFRLSVLADETQDKTYMESVLKCTRLETRFELYGGSRLIWQARVLGRTREPSRQIPFVAAGAAAVARKRSPEFEARLYQDAMAHVAEQLPARLTNLPGYEPRSPGAVGPERAAGTP